MQYNGQTLSDNCVCSDFPWKMKHHNTKWMTNADICSIIRGRRPDDCFLPPGKWADNMLHMLPQIPQAMVTWQRIHWDNMAWQVMTIWCKTNLTPPAYWQGVERAKNDTFLQMMVMMPQACTSVSRKAQVSLDVPYNVIWVWIFSL